MPECRALKNEIANEMLTVNFWEKYYYLRFMWKSLKSNLPKTNN